jgi:hypothetical protein
MTLEPAAHARNFVKTALLSRFQMPTVIPVADLIRDETLTL